MRFLKKFIVSFLAITLAVLTSFVNGTYQLKAKTYFFARSSAPSKSDFHYYSDQNIYYKYDYGMPNCTAYAWGRAYEILAEPPQLSTGMAKEWYDYNTKHHYYAYGSIPKVGSVMCWNGDWGGHVAIVEKIEGEYLTISNSSYGGEAFYTQTNTFAYLKTYYPGFQGFLYLHDFTPAVNLAKPKLRVSRSGMNYTFQWDKIADATTYQIDVCHDAECELTDEFVTSKLTFTKAFADQPYWVRVHAQHNDFASVSNTVGVNPAAYHLMGTKQNLGTHFYAQIAFGDIYVKNVNHTAMLETATNDDKGIYEFIRQKDGSYTIKDTKTKELLTSMRQKNNVDLFFTNIDDTKNQAFFLRKLKKGYALQPSDTAYAVCGVKGEKAERTTPIQINRIALTTSQSFRIQKGGITLPVNVNAYKGSYDGKAHSISLQNVPAGSTITYRTSTKSGWSSKKPTRTNAGTTMVYYHVMNPHYAQDMYGSAEIIVHKANCKARINDYKHTYDEKKHTISITKTLPGSTIYYRTSLKKDWTKEKPMRTNVGTTSVYYKISNPNARKTITGKANITVSKATQKPKIKGYNGSYDHKKHTLCMTQIKPHSTIYYRSNTKKKWSKIKPTRTSVGTTKVYYKITNPNYKDVSGSVSIIIKKKP